jgi:hypothetical protein
MERMLRRACLPQSSDRLPLGGTGLLVSPLCLGITGTPATVLAAYDAGVNFFLLSSDLHWPLYEHTRVGIAKLLNDRRVNRDDIVVAGVSYLEEPLFRELQVQEIVDSVPGLQRIDILLAGAISSQASLARIAALQQAKLRRHAEASAIGATFHRREQSRAAAAAGLIDIHFIRYNAAHPGARRDLFPYFQADRSHLVFGFKSMMPQRQQQTFDAVRKLNHLWIPKPTDYYRFALTPLCMDGLLCSPQNPEEFSQFSEALRKGPLNRAEEEYMIWLSGGSQSAPKHAAGVNGFQVEPGSPFAGSPAV